MKRIIALLIAAALLAAPALAEEIIDVQGFWYSDEVDDGIELINGVAIISDINGETTAEGSYQADGDSVTITAGGRTYRGTVSGNGMLVDAGEGIKHYARDGIEENYWTSTVDDTAFELYGGRVWRYGTDDELLAEGSYTIDGRSLTITLSDGQSLDGEVKDGELVLDGITYTML